MKCPNFPEIVIFSSILKDEKQIKHRNSIFIGSALIKQNRKIVTIPE